MTEPLILCAVYPRADRSWRVCPIAYVQLGHALFDELNLISVVIDCEILPETLEVLYIPFQYPETD